jgi:hypothetical protein
MGSMFLNAGLVAGAALAVIPLILHLFFRPKPKRVVFPALRLIRERQKQSKKKLKVKNWLLLAARIGLIVLMALALARPRLWSRASLGDSSVPTAIALVFDTSPSMGYEERDRTRLDLARDHARKILERANPASRVFVVDSSEPIAPAGLSPAAARSRVDALEIRAYGRPLNAAVRQARRALEEVEQPRREVYVFTDLARTGWDLADPLVRSDATPAADATTKTAAPKAAAKAASSASPDEPTTYIIRVGTDEPRDTAITDAEVVGGAAFAGSTAIVRATVRATGPAATRTAEFYLDGVKRDHRSIDVPAGGEMVVQFETPRLESGLHQAEIRLAGEPDPLKMNDRRFLTLDVQPPSKVLVVADQSIDADFVVEALDPAALRNSPARPFLPDRITSAQLAGTLPTPIDQYATVFVLNVSRMPEQAWSRLRAYVRNGGGLVLALGDRVDRDDWNQRGASLLPAALGDVQDHSNEFFTFGQADASHPLFRRNARDLTAELARVPVYRYAKATPNPDVRTLLSYQNADPALLERIFPGARTGHVLLWTTALSRRPGNTPQERAANWTDFPLPTLGWAFFALMNETVPYLSGTSDRRVNYEAGEDVSLPIDIARRQETFTIQGPGTQPARVGQPAGAAGLLIPAPPLIGSWTVRSSPLAGERPLVLGFSVNPPRSESTLATLAEPERKTLFGGSDQFVLVDDPTKIEVVRDRIWIGRELFPFLMLLILVLITIENVLANTFYREAPSAPAVPSATRGGAASATSRTTA